MLNHITEFFIISRLPYVLRYFLCHYLYPSAFKCKHSLFSGNSQMIAFCFYTNAPSCPVTLNIIIVSKRHRECTHICFSMTQEKFFIYFFSPFKHLATFIINTLAKQILKSYIIFFQILNNIISNFHRENRWLFLSGFKFSDKGSFFISIFHHHTDQFLFLRLNRKGFTIFSWGLFSTFSRPWSNYTRRNFIE